MPSKISTFSKHAIDRLKTRGIAKELVLNVLQKPDQVIKESDCKNVYQKIIMSENKTRYLLRVFVNICKEPPIVITAYKTSKVEKYEY